MAPFLTELARAHRSMNTLRAYASDLCRLALFHDGPLATVTPAILHAFLADYDHRKPASRARMHASLSRFFTWAVQHDLLAITPMAGIAAVRVAPPPPRPWPRAVVEAILAAIPATQWRDQLLFRLMAEVGLRVQEVLTLVVENLRLERDTAWITVVSPDGIQRTVRITDSTLVTRLTDYVASTSYREGPVFRAACTSTGGPLGYKTVQLQWAQYCAAAGVSCTLRHLRPTQSGSASA